MATERPLSLGGTVTSRTRFLCGTTRQRRGLMNGIIYLVGLVVVILFILSFLGLR